MLLESFLLIDDIIILDVDEKRIETRSWVDPNSVVFANHFPARPIVPGVMLVEYMAQSAGKLIEAMSDEKVAPLMCRIKRADFRSFVSPPADLHCIAHVSHMTALMAGATAQVTIDGQLIAEADLRFRLVRDD